MLADVWNGNSHSDFTPRPSRLVFEVANMLLVYEVLIQLHGNS